METVSAFRLRILEGHTGAAVRRVTAPVLRQAREQSMNVCAARQQILNGPQFATLFHEIGPLHDLDIWLGKKLDRRKGLCNRTRQGVALGIAGYGKFCRTQFLTGRIAWRSRRPQSFARNTACPSGVSHRLPVEARMQPAYQEQTPQPLGR